MNKAAGLSPGPATNHTPTAFSQKPAWKQMPSPADTGGVPGKLMVGKEHGPANLGGQADVGGVTQYRFMRSHLADLGRHSETKAPWGGRLLSRTSSLQGIFITTSRQAALLLTLQTFQIRNANYISELGNLNYPSQLFCNIHTQNMVAGLEARLVEFFLSYPQHLEHTGCLVNGGGQETNLQFLWQPKNIPGPSLCFTCPVTTNKNMRYPKLLFFRCSVVSDSLWPHGL